VIKIVTHSSVLKLAYKDETAQASGGGATKNSPTELVEANLTAIDKHRSWKTAVPIVSTEEIYSLGGSEIQDDDVPVEATLATSEGNVAYLQTSILYDWAMSATAGNDGTSKAFRYLTDSEKDLYGCYITEYTLNVERGQPILQEYTYVSTQGKFTSTTPIAGSGIPAFSNATIQVWSDCSFTVDAKTIANLNIQSLTYKITNIWTDDAGNRSLEAIYPVEMALNERHIEITINFATLDSVTWLADVINGTVQYVTATLDFGLFTLTMDGSNELKPSQETQDELENKGFIPRSVVFKSGKGFSPVKS